MNGDLNKIIRLVDSIYGMDISVYDESFIKKNLDKRVLATACTNYADYYRYLVDHSNECDILHSAISIGYSDFFRNRLAFALLETVILPRLLMEKGNSGRAELRIWSAGCAAGQEAYSIAMLLDAQINNSKEQNIYRIFATDSSVNDLNIARAGIYDLNMLQNVRMKEFHTYFTREGESYKIIPRIRNRIDFSEYDLLEEKSICPPACIFGDFDLLFCCNLLLYYRQNVRQFILEKVWQSLAPNGFFIVGETEKGCVEKSGLFRAFVSPASIFRKIIR